ncbi:MAG: efflux RND transporter permease subunit [Roseovarius sp.]|uniref:efflux RND transporter permease subunit n=1 Tax=Roseovarius sp. TaxID=1486281 RepID=UPI001B5C9B8A|nr:efflux RND transporter permease subunit [Roseovarius sp.]MBQ0748887.1 efflux RND transporter permease subunit [Roseovarius sp.]MBQ0812103.1 efflux RND transporter permease subunit [Roseovarius sp.]
MTGLVDWAAARARMVLAFIVLSVLAGTMAYVSLPKEGEPDIEVPALFISVPFPGISAEDSEKLLVKVMETELSDLDGLKKMTGTAAENYGGVALEFEFGWDKTKTLADVRDAMDTAEADFPEGAEKYTLNEVNFSEFPIIIVNLSGPVPERTMSRLANDLQDTLEGLEPVLEAGIAGNREEMLEVIIDPLRLEAYNVTALDLINVVQNNNQLIAAGEVDTTQGTFAVKIPSSFEDTSDFYNLPVKTNGDRIVRLGDLATINLTFEDRLGTARFNGETTVALQVVKRKGFNIIETADLVRAAVAEAEKTWPEDLQVAVSVGTSNDQSSTVASMVSQLEGSVLTAIALVMIVTLAALGIRPALLVGFSIPTSFLLCFALLAVMGVAISNIVMFGLILAVGMLVDGAIVVVEYADKRIEEGEGPMTAYVGAAKRMFWPVVSSTATTLCAFLPMLFWPGIPGQFMGMLPVTLIFVLSASLLVALVYLPVLGGVTGRLERWFNARTDQIAGGFWLWHVLLFPVAIGAALVAGQVAPALLNEVRAQFSGMDGTRILGSVVPVLTTIFGLMLGVSLLMAVGLSGVVATLLALVAIPRRFGKLLNAARHRWLPPRRERVQGGYQRSAFGWVIHAIAGNPVMPLVAFGAIFVLVGSVLMFYINNNNGTEFFVDSEPERGIVYVRGRGNLSIDQKDQLVKQVEDIIRAHPGIQTAFAFAGDGGLDTNTGGAQPPRDTIGQIQFETIAWEDRPQEREPWFTIPLIDLTVSRDVVAAEFDGDAVIAELSAELEQVPGIKFEVLAQSRGPASAKPVHLRLKSDNWDDLIAFTEVARQQFDATEGLHQIEDTLPLPGIDWQIDVDVEKAGRFGADVATVGAMVQLVTRGILLDTMRVDSSDEEIEIRVRLPDQDRVLSTLDSLKVRTDDGLVPLSNFVTRKPVKQLAQIDRIDQTRFFDIKAAVKDGEFVTQSASDLTDRKVPITANERITHLTEWLESGVLPPGISYEWTGDAEDQAESGAFLQQAFVGALGLMFIILLAQFNSVYNAVLVLLAVVLSTTGVLIGMLVMDQPFSIIMTGTGIVALAGIVVNNNIVLIDTFQEYARYMPQIEAITRTAQDRIRPVLLTTITTMAGLAPMMFGLSLDFVNGGYAFDSPTALWWKQLATAVVFGLGIATVLTLVFTPAMLALRVWLGTYALWGAQLLAKLSLGRSSRAAQDWALARTASRLAHSEIVWPDEHEKSSAQVRQTAASNEEKADSATRVEGSPLRAAE